MARSKFKDASISFTEWSRLPWARTGFDDPAASALVSLPAFRLLLVRELDRKEAWGSVSLIRPNLIRFEITNHMNMSGSRGIHLPPDSQATNGIQSGLRWCDWLALSLAQGNSIPAYHHFAPVDECDEALKKAEALLRQR